MPLYCPDVYIPEWFSVPTERVTLKYSRHALYACNNDDYGSIPVFETIPLSQFVLVELGVGDGEPNQHGIRNRLVTKIVMRGRYDKTRDLTFVLIPSETYYFVKTCWFNMHRDTHKTLDVSRYATV